MGCKSTYFKPIAVALTLYGCKLTFNLPLARVTGNIFPFPGSPAVAQTLQDKETQASRLYQQGIEQFRRGELSEALKALEQAVVLFKETGNYPRQAGTLNSIGAIYNRLGQPSQALNFYQQALAIQTTNNQTWGMGITYISIGLFHADRGEYNQALHYYERALETFQKIGYSLGEGTVLSHIASIYFQKGEYPKALEFYQKALQSFRIIYELIGKGERIGQPNLLDPSAFTITGYRINEANTLTNLGRVYSKLGQYSQAQEFLQQALAIQSELSDRLGQAETLSSIAAVFEKQNSLELAVTFYKQSVNITESIRKELRELPIDLQQSFTQTVADRYRSLANLLLKQDRVGEAQRILDLLKVQELENYWRYVPGNNETAKGIEKLPLESEIWAGYTELQNQAIQLGKELAQLRAIPPSSRSPIQEQRIAELEANNQKVLAQFNEFIESPQVIARVEQLKKTAKGYLDLEHLNSLRDNLLQLNQNTVLLYPLVLKDRLELVLVTPYSAPIRRTAFVKEEDLNKAIENFRSALQSPQVNPLPEARYLYNFLIKPIENDLAQAKAETIIYAPDGKLRYIPLAALHNGQQWLVERFRINHITAASLTDLNTKPQPQLQILAAAFSQGSYSFQLGERKFTFNGLSFAGQEVANIAAMIPGTAQVLNSAFNPSDIIPKLDDYTIVHLATHAAFIPGQPEDSFILFGNGDRITLPEVKKWSLKNVDLLVLSACETAVGSFLGTGEEILGFGYLMEKAGVRAVLASLWSVDDGGTQALMSAFYSRLQQGQISKAEALRQAQIALITGNYKVTIGEERGIAIQERIRSSLPPTVSDRLQHPYYWAPFILLGNGL